MRLIVDTGPIIAQAERVPPYKAAARSILLPEPAVPILTPMVAAEIDYFLTRRAGLGGSRTFSCVIWLPVDTKCPALSQPITSPRSH